MKTDGGGGWANSSKSYDLVFLVLRLCLGATVLDPFDFLNVH